MAQDLVRWSDAQMEIFRDLVRLVRDEVEEEIYLQTRTKREERFRLTRERHLTELNIPPE